MRLRFLKYILPFLFFFGAWRSFNSFGWTIWLPVMAAFFIIPVLELFIKPDPSNMNAAEEEMARKSRIYDVLLYFVVAFQYFALYQFLVSMKNDSLA